MLTGQSVKEPAEKGPEKDTLQKTGKTEANRIL